MNIEQARFNMIEQQIRTWDVLDQDILALLTKTPRERFVPAQYRALAFADIQIPLGSGEVMMQPKVEGRVLQALAPQPEDRVLEIGTGSGFLTACLAQLTRRVTSVDLRPEFTEAARVRLADLQLRNVTLETGDAAQGWDSGRFDVIAVTASLPVYHDAYARRLDIGGRLFVVVGTPPVMEARLYTRQSEDAWTCQSLFETDLPPLVNAPRPPQFSF
jgi:protein-L-isoaspartate(D-aspartate) O-methyltransferase